MKFDELCMQWLEFKKCTVKLSTMSTYRRTIVKRILPKFGNVLCHDLKENSIVEYINDLSQKQLSAKTVRDTVVILKGIIKFGNMRKVTSFNLDLIPCPKVMVKRVEVLSTTETQLLLEYMKNHPHMKNIGIYLSLYAGMRLGEVCALSWEHIDLYRKIIHVHATMQRIYVSDGHTEVLTTSAKTHHSMRDIPMIMFLCEKLDDGVYHEGYVLTNSHEYVEPRNMQRFFKKIMNELEIKKDSFHVLRHTFATRCVECNIDIKSLSEILGHSSVNMTLNRYVHSSFEMKYQQIQKLCYTDDQMVYVSR